MGSGPSLGGGIHEKDKPKLILIDRIGLRIRKNKHLKNFFGSSNFHGVYFCYSCLVVFSQKKKKIFSHLKCISAGDHFLGRLT